MRIPLPPITFKKNEDEIFFCVRTDMEIENSMFHKKDDTFTIDYTKIDKSFEFYDDENEPDEYLVPVKKGEEFSVIKLIAKYFLDWLNEYYDRDLSNCTISNSIKIGHIVKQCDLYSDKFETIEDLIEGVNNYVEEVEDIMDTAMSEDWYYQKWKYDECEYLVTLYKFGNDPVSLADKMNGFN